MKIRENIHSWYSRTSYILVFWVKIIFTDIGRTTSGKHIQYILYIYRILNELSLNIYFYGTRLINVIKRGFGKFHISLYYKDN